MVRILIGCKTSLLCLGLRSLFNQENDLKIVGEAVNESEIERLLSLTGLDFTRDSRLMFTSRSRPVLTSHSRPMFTTHSRPVFTTVAYSLPRQKAWESNRHGAHTREHHTRNHIPNTTRGK